jgi:hypothetical protein
MNTCGECEFYEQINGCGHCKIKSPMLSCTPQSGEAQWPVVQSDDKACGEFAAAH